MQHNTATKKHFEMQKRASFVRDLPGRPIDRHATKTLGTKSLCWWRYVAHACRKVGNAWTRCRIQSLGLDVCLWKAS